MTGAVVVADAGPGAEEAVRAAAPLAAGLGLRVGPFVVPVALLAGDARVENEDSEAGSATRTFLHDDPWAGMGSVRPGGWMFLARDDDCLVIGQRHGPIGLGAVVTLLRHGERYAASAMGAAALTTGVPHERVEALSDAAVDGADLTVSWDCGASGGGRRALRRADRILLEVGDTDVHVLLVSVPVGEVHTGWHAGTGMTTTSSVRLDGGLGGRAVFSDHAVPAVPLRAAIRSDGSGRRTLEP